MHCYALKISRRTARTLTSSPAITVSLVWRWRDDLGRVSSEIVLNCNKTRRLAACTQAVIILRSTSYIAIELKCSAFEVVRNSIESMCLRCGYSNQGHPGIFFGNWPIAFEGWNNRMVTIWKPTVSAVGKFQSNSKCSFAGITMESYMITVEIIPNSCEKKFLT